MNNAALNPSYANIREELKEKLCSILKLNNDPRLTKNLVSLNMYLMPDHRQKNRYLILVRLRTLCCALRARS
jgi:hypothetical protein